MLPDTQPQPVSRRLACGCTVNAGGYPIRSCEECELAARRRLKTERCEHGLPLEWNCGFCRFDSEQQKREDQVKCERSWGV